jgi:hypothetical protein
MSLQTVASLFIALVAIPQVAASAQGTSPAIERIASQLELSRIIAAGSGSDGRICVLDDKELRLHCLRVDGTPLWSFGRKGEGPGEWTSIYRLGLTPDNAVTVLGLGGQVHQVGADGKFLRQARLPLLLGQPGNLLFVSRDTFVVSGMSAGRSAANGRAIHLFAFQGDSIVLLRSFGSPPEVADRTRQAELPMGPTSLTPRGTVLHARGTPNTVTEYTLTGRIVRQVTGTIVMYDRSKETSVTTTPGRTTYRAVPPPTGSNRLASAREYHPGAWMMLRTTVGVGQFFDVVDPATNRWQPPRPLPAWPASLGVFAEDRLGGYFLATTTCDDEPCLVRFKSAPYVGEGGPRAR